MADVILIQKGTTRDGRNIHEVVQVAEVPAEVTGKKGEKQNLSETVVDEFGIIRPIRLPWLSVMYEGASNPNRRK